MKAQCNICKKIFSDLSAGAAHMAEHEPKPAPRGGAPVFKVGWKKDGTIREPREPRNG